VRHKAVQYPDCLKSIQEVNERVYTVLGMHWNTLYPDCVRNIHAVNGCRLMMHRPIGLLALTHSQIDRWRRSTFSSYCVWFVESRQLQFFNIFIVRMSVLGLLVVTDRCVV